MAIKSDAILECFRQRDGDTDTLLPRDATYRLMQAILAERSFSDLDALAKFCQDPQNLRPWLPNELDRRVLADRLMKGLHDMYFLDVRVASRAVPSLADHQGGGVPTMPRAAFASQELPVPQPRPPFRWRLL